MAKTRNSDLKYSWGSNAQEQNKRVEEKRQQEAKRQRDAEASRRKAAEDARRRIAEARNRRYAKPGPSGPWSADGWLPRR
jgi:hypothetical protein